MGFGIPYEYCVIIMSVLTAVYVILGGYKATALNDFIQGIIMLFGIVTIIAAVLNTQGGLSYALSSMAELPSDADPAVNGGFASVFGPDPWNLVGVVVLTSLGTWGLPQMVGKFYSITDEKAIKRGTIISTVFALVVAGGCYFLGGFGRLFFSEVPLSSMTGKPDFDQIVPAMLGSLPAVLISLVVLLVLSASMSTLASLVLTSASTMTLDLIYRDKKAEPGEVEEGTIDDIVAEKIERRKVESGGDEGAHRVLHRHRTDDSTQSAYIHRTAHGNLMGSFGGSIPRAVPHRTLLEKRHTGSSMGLLYLGRGNHCGQYVPGKPNQPNQLWCDCHGGWIPCRHSRQPLHTEDVETPC